MKTIGSIIVGILLLIVPASVVWPLTSPAARNGSSDTASVELIESDPGRLPDQLSQMNAAEKASVGESAGTDTDDDMMLLVVPVISVGDADHDGYRSIRRGGDDCDDRNPDINPGASEICDDGLDNDCDTAIDSADTDCVSPYSHTITIDGVNDFTALAEAFSTSSNGYTGYLAWDATYLYIGFEGSDVGANSDSKWLLVYIGGSTGTTTGLAYGTQQPNLPFAAQYHICWRTDGNSTSALIYHGATWSDGSWDFTGDVNNTGSFVELRIPLEDIGSPAAHLRVHVCMINAAQFSEWSYAAVPSGSFVDSFDPDYSKYFDFNLTASTEPNDYVPQ